MSTNPPLNVVSSDPEPQVSQLYSPLIWAGVVLGIGQGGFFDGIVFHQLLQWHHMFSSVKTEMTIAGMTLNTFGDGLFDLFNWLLTLTGIFLLWRAGRLARTTWSGQILIGALLTGAGGFNLFEGIIDHQILGIHHLKPGPNQFAWDMGFLGSGVLLLGIGLLLIWLSKAGPNHTEQITQK
jgi:uncharacterized membrane protein